MNLLVVKYLNREIIVGIIYSVDSDCLRQHSRLPISISFFTVKLFGIEVSLFFNETKGLQNVRRFTYILEFVAFTLFIDEYATRNNFHI